MSKHSKFPLFRLALCLIFLGVTAETRGNTTDPYPGVESRIQFYQNKIAQHPRLYPAYAQLAIAYLDKARTTHEAAWLTKARSALKQSLDIQPNFLAYKAMTAVSNFSHRFKDTLRWGQRAAATLPEDTEVVAMLVEAHMGLGDHDKARSLLPPEGTKPSDFYTAAALGQWLSAMNRYDEAYDAFQAAARFAEKENVTPLFVWATIRAAGTRIDSGKPDLARPLLDRAGKRAPDNPELSIHRAEIFTAEGRLEDALAVYQRLLETDNNAAVHHLAFTTATKLGLESRASIHFKAAEASYQRAIEAGEFYTLEALARLYCDGNTKLEQAVALAQQNLRYKQDAEARTLHKRASKMLTEAGRATS